MIYKTRSALIAGEGKMPFLIAQEMLREGIKPLIIAMEEASLKEFKKMGLEGYSLHPIQISRACRMLKKHGVEEVTWAGRIPHRIIMDIRPWHLSPRLIRLWFSLPDTRADTVLRALCDYFQEHGIRVLSSLRYLSRYLLKREVEDSLSRDALLGVAAAKTLGAMDIGQSVVIRKGTVVALEGMEGTDRCLDRAIELGSEGATLVKMAKPCQDARFDVPVIGKATFDRLLKGKFSALVVEDSQILCIDPANLEKAKQQGLKVYVIGPSEVEMALKAFSPRWQ